MEIRERDYLMRQFHQLAKVLARLLGFKEKDDHAGAKSYIEESYKEILDLDLKEINAMLPDELLDYLLEKQKMNLAALEKTAEILREEAYLYRNGSISDLFASRAEKALHLLNYVQENDKTFSFTRKAMIDSLRKDLAATN